MRGYLIPDWWPEIAEYTRLERYSNRRGLQFRLEISGPRRLLSLEGECAGCGKAIHPVRERRGATYTGWYVSVTCERAGCQRGEPARQSLDELIAFLAHGKVPTVAQARML